MTDISLEILAYLCFFAFLAGFIDSVVGGGGLVQLPALLIFLPSLAIPAIIGTHKLASFSGTFVATIQYARKVKLNWKFLIPIIISAGIFSVLGARLVSSLDKSVLKPLILVLLILVLIYTYLKKDLGNIHNPKQTGNRQLLLGLLIGGGLGFYDGFFGPGTGSFLIFAFVIIFGLDFLNASANAKIINCATNIPAIVYFLYTGDVIFKVALPLAVFNIMGSVAGSRLALTKGSSFVRMFFLIVVTGIILRFAYDILKEV